MSVPVQLNQLPRHVAIIMDGNGRWAKARKKPRVFGHKQGVITVRNTVEHAANMGIKCLTLYSFSTENWSRPKAEIAALFGLLKKYVSEDLQTLNKRGVRVRILGSRNGLSADMIALLDRVETTTQTNTKFLLNIAFNYGGRDEIIRAVNACISDSDFDASCVASITEESFEKHLDTYELPELDLVIRTSGEHRISNFLLWQAAYAEFVFLDVLWPDFGLQDLKYAISLYQQKNRRFGNLDTEDVA